MEEGEHWDTGVYKTFFII